MPPLYGDSIDELTDAIGRVGLPDILAQPFKQRLASFTRLATARARLDVVLETLQASIEDTTPARPAQPVALPAAPVAAALAPAPTPAPERREFKGRSSRPAHHKLVAQRVKVLNITQGSPPVARLERVAPTTNHLYKMYWCQRISRDFDRLKAGDVVTISAEAVDDGGQGVRSSFYLRDVIFGAATELVKQG